MRAVEAAFAALERAARVWADPKGRAALLVEACPAFRHVATWAPPFQTLPPNNARDRFHRAVQALLSVVATPSRSVKDSRPQQL